MTDDIAGTEPAEAGSVHQSMSMKEAGYRLSNEGSSLAASPLRRTVDLLGMAVLAAYASMAALSYCLTPVLWAPPDYPNGSAFFAQFFGQANLDAIRSFFGGPMGVIIANGVPLLIASAAAVALLIILARTRDAGDDALARRILHWSLAFAAVSVLAYPVFTQDFWLSALWGDMIVSGINPYHQAFTPEMLKALPLDHFPMTMSYGPLWALISAAVMALSGGSLLITALLFKSLLLAAWCATLLLVDRLARGISPGNRTLAIVIIGWLPLGVVQTVAEGHNDIAMALPALLWLALLLQRKSRAPMALAASVLCKYATAPLFLIDLIHSVRVEGATIAGYARRMVLPLMAGLAIIALFYRSFGFFDGVRLVDSWRFMQPSDAFLTLTSLVGDWIAPGRHVFAAIFLILAVNQCLAYWNAPGEERMLRAILAVICAVSFALIGHIWPWYLVWSLPMAALIPGWWLSRFVIGVALFAPFTAAVWWVPAAEDYQNFAALLLYSGALLWTYLTAPKSAAVPEAAPAQILPLDLARLKEWPALRVAAQRTATDYPAKPAAPVKAASGKN
jgi:alpha-1,6-mannosyltransferase